MTETIKTRTKTLADIDAALARAKDEGKRVTQMRISFEAGVFLWKPLRDAVRLEQFNGSDIRMFESSGWFIHDFEIKGDPEPVRRIAAWLESVNKETEAKKT